MPAADRGNNEASTHAQGEYVYLALVVAVWIILGIFLVKWKDWRECYPTVLYYLAANLLYEFLYYNHTLWAFKAITTDRINHTIILMAFLFIIVPVAIMIYLQRFPGRRLHQVIYVGVWVLFFWFIEFLFYKMGMFVYGNGWSIWHSAWFDLAMFILFRIHQKKPLLAAGLSAVCFLAFIILFPIPFTSLK
jgi:hypothetical protein